MTLSFCMRPSCMPPDVAPAAATNSTYELGRCASHGQRELSVGSAKVRRRFRKLCPAEPSSVDSHEAPKAWIDAISPRRFIKSGTLRSLAPTTHLCETPFHMQERLQESAITVS